MFEITGRAFPLGKLAQVWSGTIRDRVTEPQISTVEECLTHLKVRGVR